MKYNALAMFLLPISVLFATTPGWENFNPNRREVAPAKIVWQADFTTPTGFSLERRDGAEGRIVFSNDALTIEKTNDKGFLVLRATPFPALTNLPLRLFADVNVSTGDYQYAQMFLRVCGKPDNFTRCWKLDARYFSMGGADEMCGAVNSAPGGAYRKYVHYRVGDDGMVSPVIVVSGTPSVSTWRNWTAEDLDVADAKWAGWYESKTAVDHSAERMDEAAFDHLVTSDVEEHTAKLAKVDGVTRLLVDGNVSVPVAYRSKSSFGEDALLETFAGGPVVRQGVRLVVKTVAMGGRDGEKRRYWTQKGFDVKGAVRDVKDALRIAPDALCILGIGCNAYPDFARVEHPDEIWRLEDGTPVKGTLGSCEVGYDDMGVRDTNRWPWVSYASPAWRNAIKTNIRSLVSELKRTGLAKRIVGVHFSGYHDGQFFSPYPDFSDCAKAEYERYLKETPPIKYEYAAFSRLLGFRAQEDFAREFKAAMGKDVVAIRWCMGPFLGALDLTAFAFSDVIDICVPQPTYETRRPGMVMEPKLPFSSFDLHCKMYWNELDFRTYGALETWARSGVVATKGLGQSDDFAMWRTVYRKAAGMTIARHSGYWFYDMGGGWFSPPEIARDIGEVVKVQADLLSSKPSVWRPSVAVVADEAGLGMCAGKKRHPFVMHLFRRQLSLFAASGVPYEFYLAEDVLRNPSLLHGCRTVVLGLFRLFDERRRRFVEALARDGRTLVFLSESGVEGGASVTGFDLSYSTNSMPHEIVQESEMTDVVCGYMASERRRHHPKGPDAIVRGPRVTVCEKDGVRVLARFASDGAPALAMRNDSGCRRVYVCEPCGLSPGFFNRLVRESGAYVPVSGGGLQVDMNGSFISLHALKNGEWDFSLPFPCRVMNIKNGHEELVHNGVVHLALTAGETCWFRLYGSDL